MVAHTSIPGLVVCERHRKGGKAPWTCSLCTSEGSVPAEPAARTEDPPQPKARWSSARGTVCAAGHKHPSKMEARVCDRLSGECAVDGTTLFRNVRMPLVSIEPKPDTGAAMYLTVDFGIADGGRLTRLIDAKCKGRVSRDWARGARAAESAWGITIEEVSQ